MSLSHFVIKTAIPQNLDSMNIFTAYFFRNYQEGRRPLIIDDIAPKLF